MSSSTGIFAIILSAVLTNNFIFSQFLGCCPFLGCSSKVDTAIGMGLAVTFVMGLASAICWVVDTYILVPLSLGFLETLAFILIIAGLVQFVEMFLKKSIPSLYSALGIYLPLITTNCAVRERIDFADYPESFEGFPICLVSAALLALAFMGFSGMNIPL